MATPNKAIFDAATKDRDTRPGKQTLSFEEVLEGEELESIIPRTLSYQNRLGVSGTDGTLFANGVPIARSETWTRDLSIQVSKDLQFVQQGVADGNINNDVWLPGLLLADAYERRNIFIVPEDEKDIRLVDMASTFGPRAAVLDTVPHLRSESDEASGSTHVVVVGDFDSNAGAKLLYAALAFKEEHKESELVLLHNPETLEFISTPTASTSVKLYRSLKENSKADATRVLTDLESSGVYESPVSETEAADISSRLGAQQSLAGDLGFFPGASGIIINGRAIGPIPNTIELTKSDFNQLSHYERKIRLTPIVHAVKDLGLDKLSTPLDFAKICSLVSLSMVSDVPEGIFESRPPIRFNVFNNLRGAHSAITVSNAEDPTIQAVAVIDPTSEMAQRTAPVLKVLSKLGGVNVKIFLNPREQIKEIPIKRFYRYVLDPEPSFDSNGDLLEPRALFTGLPVEALLTLGMDVPSPWLVAPKESVHDLDNIKLSSLKEGNRNVDAVYVLEHILIEGHSRDMTTMFPSRGVQLILGTEEDPHFSDTIVMANLGYFQFKGQPGVWEINLKPGRSQEIFNLDSVGEHGFSPNIRDKSNEVALLSFQGKTLFPRLSRKAGYENDDVLAAASRPSSGSAMDYVSRGLNFASGILSGGKGSSDGERHADINIFSVASGHLYERMLNIMMLSVVRNTKHSVKFWFIEQFLSPSFKTFLPHMAREYGFSYEMVTYKWPHWLRGQQEKQREIWGYKILFLDVLFPLSLEKVIFVDADQIVRTDLYDLVNLDLEGAPYGFTPMGDSRKEMEGFRFWKQGYWKNFLRGLHYHISALYVVDLARFRALAAGDRLRGQYQTLSADPNSLSNLDQDLPNNMQFQIPIKSLPEDWLWCETWCSDESLARAKTIDLCNNPLTKEPKLDRARRQVPEWTAYDEEIAALAGRVGSEKKIEEQKNLGLGVDEGEENRDSWKKDEL